MAMAYDGYRQAVRRMQMNCHEPRIVLHRGLRSCRSQLTLRCGPSGPPVIICG